MRAIVVASWLRPACSAATVPDKTAELSAEKLAAAAQPPELPAIEEMNPPAGATPEVEELLVQHAELFNERIQIENQFRDATPEAKRQALEEWEQRTEARRAAQTELAAEIARQQPALVAPVPLELPGGIDSRLREILGQQRALMNERADLENTIRRITPDEQQTQLRQWEENNATRKAALLEQLKQLSQDQALKTPLQ